MRRLSSSWTVFHKRILPAVWAVMIVAFCVIAWRDPRLSWSDPANWAPLLAPLIATAVFVVAYRWVIHGIADEVWWEGDVLRVRRGAEEVRIPLTQIVNVNSSVLASPRRVTLMLRHDTRLGREVHYLPPSQLRLLGAFRPDPVTLALIERIDQLRQRGA